MPYKAPTNYDPEDFELARRLVRSELDAGKELSLPWGDLTYHGFQFLKNRSMKYDACCGSSPFGIDAAGLDLSSDGISYAVASRAERKRIAKDIEYYVKGLMYFWSSDDSIPASVRAKHNSKGLCRDEWPENDHFPPQLYVREVRVFSLSVSLSPSFLQQTINRPFVWWATECTQRTIVRKIADQIQLVSDRGRSTFIRCNV